jgi:hypothetical protein
MQQQPQRIIMNNPNQTNQTPHYIQPIPQQYYLPPNHIPNQVPNQMGQPIRQVILPPGLQQPPFIPNFPSNLIHNMPNGALQANLVPQINIIQSNRLSATPQNQNLPFHGVRSTQIESKY